MITSKQIIALSESNVHYFVYNSSTNKRVEIVPDSNNGVIVMFNGMTMLKAKDVIGKVSYIIKVTDSKELKLKKLTPQISKVHLSKSRYSFSEI
jgi:hypothetical protein